MSITRQPTFAECEKLQLLLKGEELTGSSLSGPIFDELKTGHYLTRIPVTKTKSRYKVTSKEYLLKVLRQKWNIKDLEEYMLFLQAEDTDRIDVQNMFDDTKAVKTSIFEGFLVHTLSTIEYSLNGQYGTLPMINGSYLFINKHDTFHIDEDITILYVENFTCFTKIHKYMYLLPSGKYLLVTRLLSSNALKKWLKKIPNKYIHFGDFDLAGIEIYLRTFNEIRERASLLIPTDIEKRILKHGNSKLFEKQQSKKRYSNMSVTDKRVQYLVDLIYKYRMGYEQEGYAKKQL